jgi:hypothetical protein
VRFVAGMSGTHLTRHATIQIDTLQASSICESALRFSTTTAAPLMSMCDPVDHNPLGRIPEFAAIERHRDVRIRSVDAQAQASGCTVCHCRDIIALNIAVIP